MGMLTTRVHYEVIVTVEKKKSARWSRGGLKQQAGRHDPRLLLLANTQYDENGTYQSNQSHNQSNILFMSPQNEVLVSCDETQQNRLKDDRIQRYSRCNRMYMGQQCGEERRCPWRGQCREPAVQHMGTGRWLHPQ